MCCVLKAYHSECGAFLEKIQLLSPWFSQKHCGVEIVDKGNVCGVGLSLNFIQSHILDNSCPVTQRSASVICRALKHLESRWNTLFSLPKCISSAHIIDLHV